VYIKDLDMNDLIEIWSSSDIWYKNERKRFLPSFD